MSKVTIDSLANAYNEKLWNNFANCFPSIDKKIDVLSGIPDDVLSVLVGLLVESEIDKWLNSELELLENRKAIDLLKYEKGVKALKMFLLSMPN